MVQFKVSTLLLAIVIAGTTQDSVLAKKLNGDVTEYQRYSYQDPVIRAIAQEILYTSRSQSSPGDSNLSARGLELVSRNVVGAVPTFFKGVGDFVKRTFKNYWRGMEEDASIFDLRTYYHRKHVRRTAVAPPPSEPIAEAPKLDTREITRHRMSFGELARRHIQTDEEAHALHSNKNRRRRFSNGRIDDGLERRNHGKAFRRRMDFDQMVRGYRVSPEDLEARNAHRRRMDFDQMVRGYSADSEDLEARHGNPHRRRMEFDQIVRDYDDLESRDDDLEMLPRMSWFGKSLLIYRDVNKARLEGRSDESTLFDRDLVDGLHENWE